MACVEVPSPLADCSHPLSAATPRAAPQSHPLLAEQLVRAGHVAKLLAALSALTRPLQPQQQPLMLTAPPTSPGGGGGMATHPVPAPAPHAASASATAVAAGVAEAAGSALRVLHQLCEAVVAAEALAVASPPAVQVRGCSGGGA